MNISFITLILAYIIPLLIYVILKYQKNTQAPTIIRTALIMSIQLTASGFILTFVFKYDSISITILYLISMLYFSYRTLSKRINKVFKFKKEAMFTIVIAGFVMLTYLIFILSFSNDVFYSRYIISLFGMLLGNIVTAVVLASNEIHKILNNNRNKIVELMNLGVKTNIALNEQLKIFISTALTPTLTSMLNIGVVALPGMMTGQILAGALPLEAVMYQMLIMFGILGGITISILLLKFFVIRESINSHNQLKYESIKK